MERAARRVTFGIKTSQIIVGYDEILRVWREADQVAVFEHAWLWDHMVPLRGTANGATLEAWTLLSALAAQTSRLRLGIIVTSNRLRHPTLLAKMAATVDIISGGRLEFGIGAGGSRVPDPQALAMVHREYDAYGVDVVAPSEALAALDEACTIAKRMWTETEPFDFDGRCYRLKRRDLRTEADPTTASANPHRCGRRAHRAARGGPTRRHLELPHEQHRRVPPQELDPRRALSCHRS